MKLKRVFAAVVDEDALGDVHRFLARCWEDGCSPKITVEYEDENVTAVRTPKKEAAKPDTPPKK